MDVNGFRQLLQTRGLDESAVAQHIALAERFERSAPTPPTAADARAFISTLAAENAATFDNLIALARYGLFVKNNAVQLAALELVDGAEAMGNLYARLDQPLRDEVFAGLELPTLSTPNTERARLMQVVMERLERFADAETCTRLLSPSLRDLPEQYYADDKRRYAECDSLDEFLERERQRFVAQLEQIRDEGRLFFNQRITDEVVAYVRGDPEIAAGVRQGNVLYVTKIPYMAHEYLAEPDEEKKRYYYCHCPWARESLVGGATPVSATFCQCSAGFHKKPWEVIFGQTLQADVLESVLKGDLRCRFAIHLPVDK